MVDLLQKLDNLKDMKACLTNDFSRYKRAFNSIRSELKDGDSQSEEIHQLHLFLGNPAYPKQLIFYTLRDAVKRITGHETVLCEMIEQCADFLEQENFLLPDEKYRLIRAIPHLMLLADGEKEVRGGGSEAGGERSEPRAKRATSEASHERSELVTTNIL